VGAGLIEGKKVEEVRERGREQFGERKKARATRKPTGKGKV